MSISSILRQDALEYHAGGKPGKIEVKPTKSTATQRDLSLAYSPGVAEPCLEIAQNVEKVYDYTAKGNLVGVISNGTAVLGLGNIGPEASKPVMEGKGVLFKVFSDIDVFDIELAVTDPDEFVDTVARLEPTFGGINLEDIKSPECFEIEEKLKKRLKIPIMHDDQHGTAIISSAALLNALEIVDKKIEEAIVRIDEINYKSFKEDDSQSERQKINNNIIEINRKLREVEQMIGHASKLKLETGSGQDVYWKRTAQSFLKIRERLNRLSSKIVEISG